MNNISLNLLDAFKISQKHLINEEKLFHAPSTTYLTEWLKGCSFESKFRTVSHKPKFTVSLARIAIDSARLDKEPQPSIPTQNK
jgi:hypothetical protein